MSETSTAQVTLGMSSSVSVASVAFTIRAEMFSLQPWTVALNCADRETKMSESMWQSALPHSPLTRVFLAKLEDALRSIRH